MGPKRVVRGGWGLDLEKVQIVRLEYSEVGATGLRTTQRGVPRGWGADWQDSAWG